MNNLAMTVKETGSMFTVDARALHEWLGVRRDFSNWFKDQVERVDMVERIHYEVVFAIKGENSGGRPALFAGFSEKPISQHKGEQI